MAVSLECSGCGRAGVGGGSGGGVEWEWGKGLLAPTEIRVADCAPQSSSAGDRGRSREGRWGCSISSLVSHGFRWAICSPNTHRRGAGAWGGTDSLPHSPPTRGQVHLGEKTTAARRKTSAGRGTVLSGGWGLGGVGACLPSQVAAPAQAASCRWKPGPSGLREPWAEPR